MSKYLPHFGSCFVGQYMRFTTACNFTCSFLIVLHNITTHLAHNFYYGHFCSFDYSFEIICSKITAQI